MFQSEIGFGKLETYIKLDKLGEVSVSGSGTSRCWNWPHMYCH